ncbi:MAG TPA: hypothetical protein VJ793_05870 [Anaerolineae bacterium]|nr:hypothetical protein [Anaerolineae bacterium]
MNYTEFTDWLERIYTTAEVEMDCEQFQALLSAYVDLEIAGQGAAPYLAQVKAHLAQCPDCAEEYAGLRKVAELEARGRLPKVEESLKPFQESPALEPLRM